MMTPMHTDLIKHLPTSHAAPTAHQRVAMRQTRQLRQAAVRRAIQGLSAAVIRALASLRQRPTQVAR